MQFQILETSDVNRRYVFNVITGTLKCDRPGEVFFLTCATLQKVTTSTIAMFFYDSMKLLFLYGGKKERGNVLLFVRDTALYMTKAAKRHKCL